MIHGFTIKAAIYGSLAGRMAGIPRVNAIAGLGYVFTSQDLRARVLRPMVRLLMRLALDGRDARLILQNSDDVSLFTRSRIVASQRIRLIEGSGVDCQKFSPATKQSNLNKISVLLPARLLWDKGVAEFIKAARILLAEGRSIAFLLAGAPDPGNPAAVPLDCIEEWVRLGFIRWLGHVDDMPSLLQTVDVVVLPSYREGLPKGLIEAAACALPLVTTDVPGCREVVTDQVTGILVPPRNAEALARAIARLQDDAQLRRRLGQKAREQALRRFNQQVIIQQTLKVYEELIA